MSDPIDPPTERLDTHAQVSAGVYPPGTVAARSRAPMFVLIGIGAAILIALVTVIALVALPRPTPVAFGQSPSPTPTLSSTPSVTPTVAPVEPAPEPEPEGDEEPAPPQENPGPVTSFTAAAFDADGASIGGVCASVQSKAATNQDIITIAISWTTEGMDHVTVFANGSTPNGWGNQGPEGAVFWQLDCFDGSGNPKTTVFDLAAWTDAPGPTYNVGFRVSGDGTVTNYEYAG